MSEYTEVEQPFLQQLAAQGWTVVDQGPQLPQVPDATGQDRTQNMLYAG